MSSILLSQEEINELERLCKDPNLELENDDASKAYGMPETQNRHKFFDGYHFL